LIANSLNPENERFYFSDCFSCHNADPTNIPVALIGFPRNYHRFCHPMESPLLRAVFVGPENVGKTCLIRHISTDEFLGDGLTLPSIGANFVCGEVIATNGHRATIGLWDTPGQTSYRDLMIPPLRNADFVVLCSLSLT
jgi:hypothetical protein